MRFFSLFVFIINLFLLSSCKKYVESEAAFLIKPTPVSVATTTAQGSGASKITDLWVYVNGKFQGAYPNGNLIPIITHNEKTRVNIFAGIKNNGISETRLSWIFYDYITIDTLVESHLTITRPLTFHYNPNTVFEWKENFDAQGISLVKSLSPVVSDTNWKNAAPEDVFEGLHSAEIGLSSSTGVGAAAIMESSTPLTIPLGSTNVYLEINYKTNVGFEVGVLTDDIYKPAIFVNPSANWNKIYISLSDVANKLPNESKQKVYFRMVKTPDIANPKMFLDNIKLVHF